MSVWKTLAAVATSIAVLAPVLTIAPAAQAAGPAVVGRSDDREPGQGAESFSMLGDLDAQVGDVLTPGQMRRNGVDPTTMRALKNDRVAAESPDEPDGQSGSMLLRATNAPVLYSWRDNKGKTVNLRRNINTKIVDKHNLTWRVPRAVTQHPNKRWFVSGKKYSYQTRVLNVRCTGRLWWRKCKVVGSTQVLTSVDFRTNTSDGRAFGVTTAYCLGYAGRCPSYVKNAVNV
ncbi:hypothetical protein [Isoptericola croceus]|uniref:hypothetical protein n=1 Tax=Isoptericola croceus TaxID=3031406 RepID=UPI0023F9E811|nr:hypothetical protein [Isoptericola croceus]